MVELNVSHLKVNTPQLVSATFQTSKFPDFVERKKARTGQKKGLLYAAFEDNAARVSFKQFYRWLLGNAPLFLHIEMHSWSGEPCINDPSSMNEAVCYAWEEKLGAERARQAKRVKLLYKLSTSMIEIVLLKDTCHKSEDLSWKQVRR